MHIEDTYPKIYDTLITTESDRREMNFWLTNRRGGKKYVSSRSLNGCFFVPPVRPNAGRVRLK